MAAAGYIGRLQAPSKARRTDNWRDAKKARQYTAPGGLAHPPAGQTKVAYRMGTVLAWIGGESAEHGLKFG
ncbi:ChaR3 protein [Pseudomonas sp. Os17]|nr:ChaR3 protein [Pseudomonas sp. Os17]BAQ82667.1 ChaR3 protein [Pseudomonas sp. St29]